MAKRVDKRNERSRRTRKRIVTAAHELFVAHGFLETRIEDIAARAGVAVQTVYYAFGNKHTLLSTVLDVSIAGDMEPVPILERPWIEQLRDEKDPVEAVALLVREAVRILDRASPVLDVVRRAAAVPEVDALLVNDRRLRYATFHTLVEIFETNGHLRHELDVDTATDIVYGLLSADLHSVFVTDRGWDSSRFRDWATAMLTAQLVEAVNRS